MKDSILIKKTGKGYKLTRTLSEDIDQKDLDERIKKVEADIEAYTDAYENLTTNKEEILKKQSEKIDKDAQAFARQIDILKANLQALKDGMVLGQGKASSIVKGNTDKGAVE
jgi:succinylglutamate desuccinylase